MRALRHIMLLIYITLSGQLSGLQLAATMYWCIVQTQHPCCATAERVEDGTGHHKLNDF
jgi:hypothetical protein|tara:strand:+ start:6825 stop:7001 length:177 start_codon:yes stop_codon:yes gene_type:complete